MILRSKAVFIFLLSFHSLGASAVDITLMVPDRGLLGRRPAIHACINIPRRTCCAAQHSYREVLFIGLDVTKHKAYAYTEHQVSRAINQDRRFNMTAGTRYVDDQKYRIPCEGYPASDGVAINDRRGWMYSFNGSESDLLYTGAMWDSDEDDLNQQEIENATSKVFANLGVDPKSLQANRAANEGLAKLLGYNVVANGVWPKSPKRMMRLFRRLLARRDLAAVAKSVQASDQRSS